jgi:CBS domain-containing protein
MPATAKQPVLVGDLMTREPLHVEEDATLRDVARLFEDYEISGAPVVSASGTLVGVVSKSDLIRRCMEGLNDEAPGYLFELLSEDAGEDMEFTPENTVTVQDFMSTDLVTAVPDEPVATVARRLAEARVHRAIVVDPQNHPVGIVTSLDILGAFPH